MKATSARRKVPAMFRGGWLLQTIREAKPPKRNRAERVLKRWARTAQPEPTP